MADSIRERIMKNVRIQLRTVKVANNYNNTFLPAAVQRFSQLGVDRATVPYLIIHEGQEEATDGPDPLTTKRLAITLEIGTQHDQDADPSRSSEEICNSLRQDITKAMMADRTWTALAIDTAPLSSTPIFAEEGQPELTFFMETTIHYRHKNTDPTSLT